MTARGRAGAAALVALTLLALPFVLYAAGFGLRALTRDLSAETYLIAADAPRANAALALHMLAGAAITGLAPLQILGPVRRRWPGLHRWSGRLVVACAGAAALGGLAFVALRGTIGGPPMDAGFATYGALTLLAAVETARHARAGRTERHRAWALRLFALAMASWLYRVHYVVWHAATGGLWSEPDFSGAFDLAQNWAFFLPYLAAVEIHLRRRRPVIPSPTHRGGGLEAGRHAGGPPPGARGDPSPQAVAPRGAGA